MSVWSVSRLAIISGSVAFLAPEIGIVPLSVLAADDANAIHAPLPGSGERPPTIYGHLAAEQKPEPAAGLPRGLAALLILANSGGIVGSRRRSARAVGGRAAFGLRLAALEIFPQRRGEPPLAPRLLPAFGRSFMSGLTPMAPLRRPRAPRERALAPLPALWQGSRSVIRGPRPIAGFARRPALP